MEGDLTGATDRLLRWVRANPRYHTTERNCQSFVSFVETGQPESRAVRNLKQLGVAAAIIWGLGGLGGLGTRRKRRK